MGDLVSTLSGKLISGLDALQRSGITMRHWERIRTDSEFAEAVGAAVVAKNQELAGKKISIVSPLPALDRLRLYAIIEGTHAHFRLPDRDTICDLSTTGENGCESDEIVQGLGTELVLARIGYRMSLAEAFLELASRKLRPATTIDALLYAWHQGGHGGIPDIGSVVVLGSEIRVAQSIMVLSMARTGVGDPIMTLFQSEKGFPGGTYLLGTPRQQD